MFGLLKPCAHSAAKYGIEAGSWQTQMCGLCLGLRDGHGQLARAATNTDAILLGVLTEAQQPHPAERESAGPCPLRGMRRATVAPADSPGVRLAATASLLLGAAKIRDHVEDGETRRGTGRPLIRVSNRWHAQAQAAAAPIGLNIEPLIAAIESQTALEQAAARHGVGAGPAAVDMLNQLTAPTQLCAVELFAHTAILAGRPENADALREVGWHFGRIAHLADAIEDVEQDREHGKFNPLTATGTSPEQAHALLRESNSLLRSALTSVGLERTASIRWMLLDPLNGVIRKLGKASGAIHACTSRVCGTHTETVRTEIAFDGADQLPITSVGGHGAHGSYTPPDRKPTILEGLGIILTQYCTGYACCAEHTNPCSGKRKEALGDCSDCCDCGDCCGNCGNCGNCCSCDDCGCDCCGCDCSC